MALLVESPEQREPPLGGEVLEANDEASPAQTQDRTSDMRQAAGSKSSAPEGAETLVTEEPDASIAHVRVCGGPGWVTTGPTRQRAQ